MKEKSQQILKKYPSNGLERNSPVAATRPFYAAPGIMNIRWMTMHYSGWRGKLLLAIFPGIFVALFLNIFQPFTVNNQDGSWGFSLLIAGYGLLATLIILFTEFVIRPLSTRWLGVKMVGLWEDVFWYVWHFFTVAIGMMLYRVYLCHGTLQWPPLTELMTMLYRTAMIGVIPLILLILGRKIKQQRTLIQDLDRRAPVQGKILLSGENGKEQLLLESEDILYISSSDNYVEVHYQQKGQGARMVLRSTMTRMEALLQTQPHIMRSHRSYIVNLHQIASFRSKGKGLILSLRGHAHSIPVSSKYKESVLTRIRASNVPV